MRSGCARSLIFRLQKLEYSGGDLGCWLVLPCADDGPAPRFEGYGARAVARAIPLELRDPVRLVPGRDVPVLRAAMPKAAVNEDGEPAPRKDDVRPHVDLADADPVVDAIAQAVRVKETAE